MLTKSKDHNINYLASVIQVANIRKHANADRLSCLSCYGNNVITGTNVKDGDLLVYFPLESAISKDFLAYTNSFEDKDSNSDKTVKGFFNKHGRVRAISLRGERSEGYVVPVASVEKFVKDTLGKVFMFTVMDIGADFDTIMDHLLVKKYVPSNFRQPQDPNKKKSKGNVKKYQSKLVDGQFHFHEDTAQLKRNMHKISPDDYISITDKLHGSNFIVSNVLVKRKLKLREKIAQFLGIKVQESEYGNLYASRTVIKNKNFELPTSQGHFYDADIWKIASDLLFPSLKEGITVTGELVGFTPSGKCIQPLYDYGLQQGKMDIYVFKITYTSPNGDVYVFNPHQTIEWCRKYGVNTPRTFYYGKAKDLFPELDLENHWHDNFLAKLQETYLEKKCDICKNDVWAEGVIVRKDVPHEWEAFKLKSFNFLGYETEMLDKDISGIETVDVEEHIE